MANLLQTLIPLALLLAAANTARSQSTSFDYDFSLQQNPNLIFQGDAQYLPDNSVRLTRTDASGNPATNSVGRIVYGIPITFNYDGEQADFVSIIQFFITPVDSTPAEGLAFFIAPVDTTIPEGSGGGNFGVFGAAGTNANILAVEFDTFWNPGTNDRPLGHIGIDIETPVSSNFSYVGTSILSQVVTATIKYEHASHLITATVLTGNQNFEVTYQRDLSTLLTEQAQVGISAATGGNVAIHDISTWFFTAYFPPTIAPLPPRVDYVMSN